MTAAVRRLPLLLAFAACPSVAWAHQLDECLQATLVAIEPGDVRMHINLTPGVAVADRVLALIDRDRDGVISPGEAAAYAELLNRDLTVRLDQRTVELKPAAFEVPEPAELRTGWGIIRLELSTTTGPLAAGTHRLTLENRHLPGMSVYLVNAARPKSASVQITRQSRNENQSTAEIEFTFRPPASASRPVGIGAALAVFLVALFAGVWRARGAMVGARSRRAATTEEEKR